MSTASAMSAITTGNKLAPGVDGRGSRARRFRDLCREHASDLGGDDMLSQAQRTLIRKASALTTALEELEGAMTRGEPVDLDVFARVTGQLRRCLESLGLERKARDVTPDLQTYLQRRAREGAA